MKSVQLQDQPANAKPPKVLGLAALPAAVLALASLAIVSDLATVDLLGLTKTGEFSSVIRDLTDLPVNFRVIPADTLRATTARVAETIAGAILIPKLVAQLLVGLNVAIIGLYGATSLKRRLTQYRHSRVPKNLTEPTESVAETSPDTASPPGNWANQLAAKQKVDPVTELAPVQNSTAAVIAVSAVSAVSGVAEALFEARKRLNALRQQGQEYATQATAGRSEWDAIGMQMRHIRQLQERSIETGHTMGKSIGALLLGFKEALSLELTLAHRVRMVDTYLKEVEEQGEAADQLLIETSRAIASCSSDLGSASDLVNAQSKHAREMSSILSTVEDMIEQIKLAALNASIQTAHTSGAEQSLKIVANEVSRLSMSSSTAIRRINSLLMTVLNDSGQASTRLQSATQILSKAGDASARLSHVRATKLTAMNRVTDDVETLSNDLNLLVGVLGAVRKAGTAISGNSEALNKTQQYCAETSTRLSGEVRHAAATSSRVAQMLLHQSTSINHCKNLLDGAATVSRDISHFDSTAIDLWKKGRSTVRTASLRTFAGKGTTSQAQFDQQPQLARFMIKGDFSALTPIMTPTPTPTPTLTLNSPNQTPARSEV